jgi:hypothetical protein
VGDRQRRRQGLPSAEPLVHLATRRNGVDIPDILDNLRFE